MADNSDNGAGDPVAKRLDELRREQQESELKAKRETERAKKFKTELEELTNAKGELDQAIEEYRGNLGDLEDQRKELWRYRDQRYEAARRAVGEQQARELDTRFSDYNAASARKDQELARISSDLRDTLSDLENADRDLATAQSDFKALSGRPASIGAGFTELEALKVRLDEADDDARHALKYLLILEFDLVLRNVGRDPGERCTYWAPGDDDERPPFYSVGVYRGKLVGSWETVNGKQEAQRQAQETDADMRASVERLEAELETRRKNRVDRVAPPETADDGSEDASAERGDGVGEKEAAVT